MLRVGIRRRYAGITFFKWGIYLHLRWGHRWRHLKVGAWVQNGLRVSTRRQMLFGRPRRYVTGLRCQVSYWATTGSRQHPPVVFGFMLYWGRTKHGHQP